MPQRSTPFQAIVRLVRQHYAGSGVVVSESKMLRHEVVGVDREVDIVVEGELDGEPIVISIEVIEHGRPATLTWVEQMLCKHRYLPTNRLLLVSKSGFTANALALIEHEAGRVEALSPEIIEVDGEAVVKRFFVDVVSYAPEYCRVHVRVGEGEPAAVVGQPATDILDSHGTLLGPLAYLVQDALSLDDVFRHLSLKAHEHPNKEQVKSFSIVLSMPQLGYHIQRNDTRELHLIEELEIWGNFSISQTEVPLTLARLGHRIYASADAPIAGRPAVWVGTTDKAAQKTTISWQTTDKQVAKPAPAPRRPMQFPDLLRLFSTSASDASPSEPSR